VHIQDGWVLHCFTQSKVKPLHHRLGHSVSTDLKPVPFGRRAGGPLMRGGCRGVAARVRAGRLLGVLLVALHRCRGAGRVQG
jgi:hypothetical protein